MAIVQYLCLSCGGVHETSVRPGGAVYLRCAVTRQWAWHDPSRFVGAAAPTRASGARGVKASRPRASVRRAGVRKAGPAAKATAPRKPARKPAGRRPAARKSAGARAAAAKRRKR
jgi:hypothetical protein